MIRTRVTDAASLARGTRLFVNDVAEGSENVWRQHTSLTTLRGSALPVSRRIQADESTKRLRRKSPPKIKMSLENVTQAENRLRQADCPNEFEDFEKLAERVVTESCRGLLVVSDSAPRLSGLASAMTLEMTLATKDSLPSRATIETRRRQPNPRQRRDRPRRRLSRAVSPVPASRLLLSDTTHEERLRVLEYVQRYGKPRCSRQSRDAPPMALTDFQRRLCRFIADNRIAAAWESCYGYAPLR